MSYFVHRNGQTIGPYSPDNIVVMLRAHQLALEDLAVEEGCEDWQPLGVIVDPAVFDPPPPSNKPAHPQPARHCSPIPASALRGRTLPTKAEVTGTRTGAFTWVFALFLSVMLIGYIVNLGQGTDLMGVEERAPWNAGKGFVLQGLKSPSSAKFPSAYDGNVGWDSIGSDRWAVWGFVDSQNSFGATVRNEWRAVVERRGTDWHRLYLRLGDQEVGDRYLWSKTDSSSSTAAR
jgi:hypothetical protein